MIKDWPVEFFFQKAERLTPTLNEFSVDAHEQLVEPIICHVDLNLEEIEQFMFDVVEIAELLLDKFLLVKFVAL